VLNNLLLSTATATVLIGTLYPLFLDAVGGSKVSVGPPFFNRTFVPLMVPLIAAMAVGPLLSWKRADLAGALGRLKLAAVLTIAVLLAALWWNGFKPVMALLGIGLGVWAFVGAWVELADRVRLFRIPLADSVGRLAGLPRSAFGTALAHAGLGIAVLGMTGTSAWTEEHIQVMQIGQAVEIGGYRVSLDAVADTSGANFTAQTATMTVTRNGNVVVVLHPQQRFYPVAQMPTTEAAIHTNFYSDLYAVLGEKKAEGGWVTRLYHHPLVPWIWIGAVIIALGGLVSLSDRRLRVGVPVRRKLPEGASPAAAE
jgi:cytochrome c-type biogenesis protein CcmF